MKRTLSVCVKGITKQQWQALSTPVNDADYALAPVARTLSMNGVSRRKITSTLTAAAKRLLVCGAMDRRVTIKRSVLTKQARRIADMLVAEFAA